MEEFNHGFPENKYNKHAWVLGNPRIGERVWIGAFCLIDSLYNELTIGKGTEIAPGAQILTHSTVRRTVSERYFPDVESSSTEIGEFCFIGTNAVVLKGSKIGHHSVVGAGAVVLENSKIAPYSIVAGVPAKRVGSSKKFFKKGKQSISIVMPAYNEEKTLEKVTEKAVNALRKLTTDFELLLVDDGSNDKTGKMADTLARRNKQIKVIHHKKNMGFSAAISTALFNGSKDLILLAPADGQFDFKELGDFVEAARGYDVVFGYRVENAESSSRKFQSFIFHKLCRFLFDIKLREISSISMWRKNSLEKLSITISTPRSCSALPELVASGLKRKFRFNEVPIRWLNRQGGQPKGRIRFSLAYNTVYDLIKLWLNRGKL